MEREELSYGSIVQYRDNIVRVLEVTKSAGITIANDRTGIEYMVRLSELNPVSIKLDLIKRIGCTRIEEDHYKPRYIKKLSTSWTIEFEELSDDPGFWDLLITTDTGKYIGCLSVRYFHQMQNILTIYNQKISYV